MVTGRGAAEKIVDDAAWCYPEPTGRSNIKDHVTFATGKGICIGNVAPSLAAGKLPGRPRTHRMTTAARAGSGPGAARASDPDSSGATEPRDGRGLPSQGTEGLPLVADGPGSMGQIPTAPSSFAFDELAFSSRFLKLSNNGKTVSCHTNCGRPAQGTAFLAPLFVAGRRYRVRVAITAKPGRMCYFIGIAVARKDRAFHVDSGQQQIRQASFSLENLYSGVHTLGHPSMVKAPPCFHMGSVVTMEVDLKAKTLSFSGLANDETRVVKLSPEQRNFIGFVSLYNRAAEFTLVEAVEVL